MQPSGLNLKAKGDLAELKVATDLMRRGYKIAFPYGEDWDYDLILCRGQRLERVQVKFTRSDGNVITVRCGSSSLTNGKVRAVKHYTAKTVDWIAAYDVTSDRCYYLAADLLGGGRSMLTLRLTPSRNGQVAGIRLAAHHVDI
ncbi:MAG: group I intron-associated PD-(D/E)XK endonuclease [Actinomycetota bacterium]